MGRLSTGLPPSTVPTVSTLPGGVTLIDAPLPHRENVGVCLVLAIGSRDETQATSGHLHYLEHVRFAGTERDPGALDRTFDRLGAVGSAYTDVEEVACFADGPAANLSELAAVLAGMFQRPLLRVEDVERERGLLLQELAQRRAHPTAWISDSLPAVAFGAGQPVAWPVQGSEDVIRSTTPDHLRNCHRRSLVPDALAVVVSGGQSLDLAEAAQLFELESCPRPVRVPSTWSPGVDHLSVRTEASLGGPVSLAIALPGMSSTDPEALPLAVLVHLLGGGPYSRLMQRIRRREGLGLQAGARHYDFEECGICAISATTGVEQAGRVVELCLEELRRAADELLGPDQLDANRASFIGALQRTTETAVGSALWYARRWRRGLAVLTPRQQAEAICDVSAADIRAVAQRLWRGADRARVLCMGPADQGSELAELLRDALRR